jgi:hypothetical protein
MVPNWIRSLAQAWGHEVRKFEARLGNVQGTLGRIKDEGPGASIRGHGDYIPYNEFPREVNKFHKAWLDLDYVPRTMIWLHFKKRGKVKKKAKKIGFGKTKYYKELNAALVQIAIDFHLYD